MKKDKKHKIQPDEFVVVDPSTIEFQAPIEFLPETKIDPVEVVDPGFYRYVEGQESIDDGFAIGYPPRNKPLDLVKDNKSVKNGRSPNNNGLPPRNKPLDLVIEDERI